MPSDSVSPDDIHRLSAAIDRNQHEIIHTLGRIEQRLLQSDAGSRDLAYRCELLYREIAGMQMFHRLGFIDNRLELLSRRLGELVVRLDQLAPPRDLVYRKNLLYFICDIAMWASLIVSIFKLFGNASVAAYFVGLAVFFAVMKMQLATVNR
jgi:hypothetical protein